MIGMNCALLFCVATLVCCTTSGQSGTSSPFGGSQGSLGQNPPPPPRIPVIGPVQQTPLLEVNVLGNAQVPEAKIRSMLQTRSGRIYDPNQVEKDVRRLIGSGLFRDVKTYKKESPDGVIITFELFERPLIQHVHFIGNEKVKDKALREAVGIKEGGPLNRYSVEEGRRRLESLYQERGFGDAQISVIDDPKQTGVAYQINEGKIVRIQKTSFVGNTIASSARLKTQIDSKPGILYFMGGKLDRSTVDQDVERLTSYYRSLGYFGARVGREVDLNDEGTWAKVKFVIDEGPRYRVREIRFIGNERFEQAALKNRLQIAPGDFYNVSELRRDLKNLRDIYGSKGYITSDIDVKPVFLEDPGQLDLVYKVDEGQQFRVGRIIVNIDGEYAHTRRSVVLNRLSIRPGDVVDIRELRASERRLQSSQLFLHDPAQGVTPKIVVKAPDVNETKMAAQTSTRIRGQSPSGHTAYHPVVDLEIEARMIPAPADSNAGAPK